MSKQIPLLNVDELRKIWSSLSKNDRLVFLGHDRKELSADDLHKLMKVVAKLRN